MRRWIIVSYMTAAGLLVWATVSAPDSYSWVCCTTSGLSAQGVSGGWMARIGVVMLGMTIIAQSVRTRSWPLVARSAHIVVGMCLFACAVFSARPVDRSLPFDVVEDSIHIGSVTVMQLAFATGVFVSAWGRRRELLVGGAAAVVALADPLIMAACPLVAGLLQRVAMVVVLAWYLRALLVDGERSIRAGADVDSRERALDVHVEARRPPAARS